MKELFLTNIAGPGALDGFTIPSIYSAHKLNVQFCLCENLDKKSVEIQRSEAEKYNISFKHFDIRRNLFNLYNLKVLFQLIRFIEKEKIDVIHCNTPVGGILGRLSGRISKVNKIIYTAHGFHFYKGAPLINRTVFKWCEKCLARWTDAIITINSEDYQAAQKFRLKRAGKVYHVHGVGINTEEYERKKSDYNYIRRLNPTGVPVIVSVGELNKNKNNQIIIKAIAKRNIKCLYIVCGEGPLKPDLEELAQKLNIEDRVHFAGFRNDIKEILGSADIFCMTSYREGLSRSLMEAMASGLPCVVSKIRGNTDLIKDGDGGFLCEPNDSEMFAMRIEQLVNNPELRDEMSRINLENIQAYDIKNVMKEMQKIYREVLS